MSDACPQAQAGATSLCVFCGSAGSVAPIYLEAAWQLGVALAKNDISLVYGGGRAGLMGRLADGCLSGGGRVTGIIPRHLVARELLHTGLSEVLVVDSMHQRKEAMVQAADCFAVLPGGLGTLDEMFEVMTWRQLGLHHKDILLLDLAGFWAPLLTLLAHLKETGFLYGDGPLVTTAASVEALVAAIPRLSTPPSSSR